MKKVVQKRLSFILKSMLWSLLLYAAFMITFNWDEISYAVNGKNAITVVVNSTQSSSFDNSVNAQHTISKNAGFLKTALVIVKAISGIYSAPSGR